MLDTQHRITEYSTKHKMKKLYPILLVLDDIADDPRVARYSKLLNSVYARGRHNGVSEITTVQKFNALNTLIRVNAPHLFFYKIRNFREIELLQDELSTVVRKNNIQKAKKLISNIYEIATAEPPNSLYINLFTNDINKMFMNNFNAYLHIVD